MTSPNPIGFQLFPLPVQRTVFKNRKHRIENFDERKMEREAVSRRDRDRDRQIYGVRERMRIRER